MKIKRITKKLHSKGKKIYCFHEPVNNECIVVGQSGEYYASYQSVNFGFIFLRGAYSFKSDIEENWTEEEVDNYITENNPELILDRNNKVDKLLIVSTDIRNKFFETYPKLEEWGLNCIKDAKEKGYRDCPLGGRRHLPLSIFNTTDNRNSKEKAHYESIAVNSTVQTVESLIVYQALIDIDNEIEKRNLKSVIVASIHDSIVLYIHKSEVKEMYYIIKEAMEDYTSFEIPLVAEVELGTVWGFGEEVTEKNIEQFK